MFSSTPRCQHVIITDTNKPINIYKCSKKKIESIDCLHKHDNTHFTVHNLCRKRIFFTRATFIFVYNHRVYKNCVNHKCRTLSISRNDSQCKILVSSRCNINFCSSSNLIWVNHISNIRIDLFVEVSTMFYFSVFFPPCRRFHSC